MPSDSPPDGGRTGPLTLDGGGGGGSDGWFPWGVLVVGAAVFAVLAWFFRPWLHGLVYLLYTTPLLFVPLALGAIAGWLYYRHGDDWTVADEYRVGNRPDAQLTPLRVAALVVLLGGLIILPITNLVGAATLSDQTLAVTTEVQKLDNVDATKPRIVTRAVAQRYASNTLNRPQYRVAPNDITVVDGTPYWAAPLAPDGPFNVLTKPQGGTVLVDMTTQQSNVTTVDGTVEKGVGTIFFRNYRWDLLKHGEFLVDYGDPKMVIHDGSQYVMVPYSKPTFHLAPIPHSTPTWGGVALVDSTGSVQMLSPQEAADNPVLEEQQLYPEALAREKVASTKYRNGIVNTFTSHEGEIEVAPVPGENNDQPFFVLSEDGPQYVVAVEPYGEAQGLREVWTIDGRTGAFEVYRPDRSLFGPRKAADLVRQSSPKTDWNRFSPAEPILTVIDDHEYWQVRVVPDDQSGIAYVAFVDAQTSDVHEFGRTDAIEQFLAGKTPTNRTSGPGGGPEGPGNETRPTLLVQRIDENGTVVETMEIYGNETVRIRRGENASSAVTPTRTDDPAGRLVAPA